MGILLPLLAGTGLATPTFVVEEGPEELAGRAAEAWEAAVRCTGYEAKTLPEVPLAVTTIWDSGFLSHAYWGNAGLERIELSATARQTCKESAFSG